jgi:hypothetical protein
MDSLHYTVHFTITKLYFHVDTVMRKESWVEILLCLSICLLLYDIAGSDDLGAAEVFYKVSK